MNWFWRIFLKGLATILPIIITIYSIYWLGLNSELVLGEALKYFITDKHYWPGMGIIVQTVARWLKVPGVTPKVGMPPAEFGTIETLGDLLFRDYLFPFEAVSLLLLLAVIGAVVIARGRRGAARKLEQGKEA